MERLARLIPWVAPVCLILLCCFLGAMINDSIEHGKKMDAIREKGRQNDEDFERKYRDLELLRDNPMPRKRQVMD